MLEQIQYDIQKMISRLEVLKDENEKLNGQLAAKQAEVDGAKEEINALKQTIESLKLKSALTADGKGSEEAKAKIDSLIRQIDKCLALIG